MSSIEQFLGRDGHYISPGYFSHLAIESDMAATQSQDSSIVGIDASIDFDLEEFLTIS